MEAYAISKLVQMHLAFIVCDEINRTITADPNVDAVGAGNTQSSHCISVVVVNPGFVPDTGLGREWPWYARLGMRYIAKWLPFATSLRVGGQTIVRGMQMQVAESVKGKVTCISKRGIERPAPECEDEERRKEWAAWFAGLGVW